MRSMRMLGQLNAMYRRLGFSQKLVDDPYQNAFDDMSRSITVEQIARIAKPIVLRRHVAELYMFGSMLRGEVYVN